MEAVLDGIIEQGSQAGVIAGDMIRKKIRQLLKKKVRTNAIVTFGQSSGVYIPAGEPVGEQAGPGTELKRLMRRMKIDTFQGCECESRSAEMNKWGVEGCKQRRNEIAQWLRDAAAKRGWLERIKAAVMAVVTGIAFELDMSDLFGSLVDAAIKRAETTAAL